MSANSGKYFGDGGEVGNALDFAGASSKEMLKVFVGGIPWHCDKAAVSKHFSACGDIEWISLPFGADRRSQGIAFISFYTEDCVAKALKLDGSVLHGRTLKVNMASEKPTKGEGKRQHDKLVDKVSDGNGMKKRESDATKDYTVEGDELGRRTSKSNGASKVKGTGKDEVDGHDTPNPLEVIVKGLAFATKEDSLRSELSGCGDIESVRMPVNRKGSSGGFAFVTFQNKKGVRRALKLSGTEIKGRTVKVESVGRQCAQPLPSEKGAPIPDDSGRGGGEAEPPLLGDEVVAPRKKRKKDLANGNGRYVEQAELAVEGETGQRKKSALRIEHAATGEEEVDVKDDKSVTKNEIIARTNANREARRAKRAAMR